MVYKILSLFPILSITLGIFLVQLLLAEGSENSSNENWFEKVRITMTRASLSYLALSSIEYTLYEHLA